MMGAAKLTMMRLAVMAGAGALCAVGGAGAVDKVASGASSAAAQADMVIPAMPPGAHFRLPVEEHAGALSFRRGQPIVGTTYFYWYDVETRRHIVNRDGSDAMTDHPINAATISYARREWHEGELRDMIAAGIDFLMPVYWGVPGQYKEGAFAWSFLGLPPLVAAHDALLKAGEKPPLIGLFLDTSILQHNSPAGGGQSLHVDLSTPLGRDFFYAAMRDFFSLIPPDKWARVEGKPIVFLYSASFAKRQDPRALTEARERFRAEFGVEPFIVKHADWQGEAGAVYQWGGALGLKLNPDVAALGPGYDHSAVPGRQSLVDERRGGKTYQERWERLLSLDPARRPWMVHVETWNEWHEGTDVAHSREYGRAYIDLTRWYADLWRRGARLSTGGAYANSAEVRWRLDKAQGLTLRPSGADGVWERVMIDGAAAVATRANEHSKGRYLYFDVDDSFAFDVEGVAMEATVTYRDSAGGDAFLIQYDNADASKGLRDGAFRDGERVAMTGSGQWRTATLRLPQCRFAGRCNNADFRIAVLGGSGELAVREVVVRKAEAAKVQ